MSHPIRLALPPEDLVAVFAGSSLILRRLHRRYFAGHPAQNSAGGRS